MRKFPVSRKAQAAAIRPHRIQQSGTGSCSPRLVLLQPGGRAPQSKGCRVKLRGFIKTPLHKSLGVEERLFQRALADPVSHFPMPWALSRPWGLATAATTLPSLQPGGKGHSHANEGDFLPGNPLCFQFHIYSPARASFEYRSG